MQEFIDKTSTQEGTKINRKTLMAVQGFQKNNTMIVEDENGNYNIRAVNPETNHELTVNVIENQDDSITVVETFVGEKTITKTTTISADMEIINEVIS